MNKPIFNDDAEEEFAKRLSLSIQYRYDFLVNEDSILAEHATQEEQEFLNTISLRFEAGYSNFLAMAHYNENAITYNLISEQEGRIERTLIHELAHLIAHKFNIKSNHSLEFAILNYCLQNTISRGSTNFFRSYDIHEDVAYPYLSVNSYLFDILIKEIKFTSLKDLCQKAQNMANMIRKQAISLPMSKINGEVKI